MLMVREVPPTRAPAVPEKETPVPAVREEVATELSFAGEPEVVDQKARFPAVSFVEVASASVRVRDVPPTRLPGVPETRMPEKEREEVATCATAVPPPLP